jgi:hypothetical protein
VVFSLFSVAVLGKCCGCYVCGHWKDYFRWGCRASLGAGVWEAMIVVDRKSMCHTVDERSWRNLVFSVISVAVVEKCCGCNVCG